jgi:hypothetical protein
MARRDAAEADDVAPYAWNACWMLVAKALEAVGPPLDAVADVAVVAGVDAVAWDVADVTGVRTLRPRLPRRLRHGGDDAPRPGPRFGHLSRNCRQPRGVLAAPPMTDGAGEGCVQMLDDAAYRHRELPFVVRQRFGG